MLRKGLESHGQLAKLKSILRSPKIKLNYKIRLFKAACISILLYRCETRILTETLIDKLDIYARICYRIMLCINQSIDHVKNQSLYQLTGLAASKLLSYTADNYPFIIETDASDKGLGAVLIQRFDNKT